MNSIQQRIEQDSTQALKEGDKEKRAALSYLLSELQTKAKDERTETLSDPSAIALLQKQRKLRQETIAQSTGRDEAIAKATYEIALIESYLPVEPTEDEIKAVVADVITSTGAASLKDMGKVMGAAKARLSGVDNAKLSAIIKAALTSA